MGLIASSVITGSQSMSRLGKIGIVKLSFFTVTSMRELKSG